MPATIRLDIVSAERELFSGECEMVVAPGAMGELGILPRHTPLITRLKPGEVRATMAGGEEQSFYVSGGMLEIQPHVVTVLSDTGQRAEDLDEAAALAAQEQAERMLADRAADIDEARARAELAPGRRPAPGDPPGARPALKRRPLARRGYKFWPRVNETGAPVSDASRRAPDVSPCLQRVQLRQVGLAQLLFVKPTS